MNTLTNPIKNEKDLPPGKWTVESLMPLLLLYNTKNSTPDECYPIIFLCNGEWCKGFYYDRLGFYSRDDCTGVYPTVENIIYYFYAGGE